MRERTQQEINELGFKALVAALGREDAIRFIDQFTPKSKGAADVEAEDHTLPPYTPNEIHDLIREMQEPTDQAHLL